MDEHIKAQAEIYRHNGRWNILLRAPRWLISDVANQIMTERGAFVLANHGGGMDEGTHTMLIQTAARVSEQQIPLLEAATEFRAAVQAHKEADHDCNACEQHLDELQQAAQAAYERAKAARQRLLGLAEGKA